MLHDLNSYILLRLILAAFLGGLIGLERQLRHKPAGIRTNMLICFGAALFTIISYVMAGEVTGDHTRIAAQIIPGIGFIGAGVVIRERGAVLGITSAATIFVMASIGMAVGAGMLGTAIFATLLVLVALVALGILEDRLGLHTQLMTFQLTTPIAQTDLLISAHILWRKPRFRPGAGRPIKAIPGWLWTSMLKSPTRKSASSSPNSVPSTRKWKSIRRAPEASPLPRRATAHSARR